MKYLCSTFKYSNLKLSKTTATAADTIVVSVDVTNESTRNGAEVVQLYVKDVISSVAVPNLQLRGFAKVPVAAGATQTVEMQLKVQDLGLWDIGMKYVVEPGDFKVSVAHAIFSFLLTSFCYLHVVLYCSIRDVPNMKQVFVGSSSKDFRANATFTVA